MPGEFEKTDEYLLLSPLLAKMVDNELDQEEVQTLVELLHESDSAKEYYLRYLEVHTELAHRWGAAEQFEGSVSVSPRSKPDGRVSTGVLSDGTRSNHVANSTKWRNSFLVPLAVCVATGVLIGVALQGLRSNHSVEDPGSVVQGNRAIDSHASFFTSYPQSGDLPPEDVAVVVHANNTGGSGLPIGHRLKPGVLKLKQGGLQLEFMRGAIVALQAGSELQLISGQSAKLVRGGASVYVPDRARGFLLAAPDAAVYDIGTAFSLHVGEDGVPEVEVTRGQVEFSLLGDDGNTFLNQRLDESTRVRADKTSKSLVEVPAEDDVLAPAIVALDESPLRISTPYVEAVVADRPLLYWRFESQGETTRNEVGDRWSGEISQSDGGIEDGIRGVAFVDGCARFQATKGASRFIASSEAIEGLNLGAYSIEFWMKPADLHHATCVAVYSESDDPGETKHLNVIEIVTDTFLIHEPGALRFLHRNPPKHWHGNDTNAFTPGLCTPGQWQHVVVVKKTNQLEIYLNGNRARKVAVEDCDAPGAFSVLVGQLGPNRAMRQFVGLFDEFAIYNRDLTASEIQRHFRLANGD